MNPLSSLKIMRPDEKTEKQREYHPATPFVVQSPIRETSPEVLKEYLLLVIAIVSGFMSLVILFLFR
jgi:hypothetical protein